MKTVLISILVVAVFFGGFLLGANMGERTMDNRCEQRVVDSIANGKEFMFLNGDPVVIMSTLRSDRSVIYKGMRIDSRKREAENRRAMAESCESCHGPA